MDSLLEANRLLHIVFASVGLAAWWVPILTKKGGEHHKSFCGYIVGITAVVGASTRPSDALWQGAVLRDNVEAFGLLVFWPTSAC